MDVPKRSSQLGDPQRGIPDQKGPQRTSKITVLSSPIESGKLSAFLAQNPAFMWGCVSSSSTGLTRFVLIIISPHLHHINTTSKHSTLRSLNLQTINNLLIISLIYPNSNMGNFTSCCSTVSVIELQTPKLIDFNGSIRRIKVPITAAELMLEQPGHFISPAEDLRRTLRYSAMKADEELSAGKLYVLVPTSRLHSKASVAEMAVLESACQRRRPKRRSAKVLAEEEREGGFGLLGENDTGCRLGVNCNRQWRPALEPICEGI